MIETSRLFLYRPVLDDYHVLSGLWRNEQVRQFLGGVVADKEISKKLAAIQKHWDQYDFGLFSICNKSSKKILGMSGLHYSENNVELSYMLFPEYWGKGMAVEATSACVCYGFEALKLEEIIAITQEANRGSWKLLEKIGMHHIKTISKFNAIQRIYNLTKENSLLAPNN